MSIHFAAARGRAGNAATHIKRGLAIAEPANENGGAGSDDRLLYAALRHFGEHGLAAASRARANAEKAFFDGDREAYDEWLAICRVLDRRLAVDLARKTGA